MKFPIYGKIFQTTNQLGGALKDLLVFSLDYLQFSPVLLLTASG
jgi:hypothetical protein